MEMLAIIGMIPPNPSHHFYDGEVFGFPQKPFNAPSMRCC